MGGPAGGQGAGRERKAASLGSSRGVAGFVSFALSCPPYTITTMNSLTPCGFMGENMYFLKCHKHSIEEYQSPGMQPPGDSYQERLPLKSNKPALAEHTHNAVLGRTPERPTGTRILGTIQCGGQACKGIIACHAGYVTNRYKVLSEV